MAIFSNSNESHKGVKSDTSTTIITAGSKTKGEMNLTCNLYVDGSFDGIINSAKEVYIGKNGYISGEVMAQKLIIQGFIEGKINAKRVEIKEGGKVKGTIESSELVIEARAIFEGNSVLKNSAPASIENKTKISKS